MKRILRVLLVFVMMFMAFNGSVRAEGEDSIVIDLSKEYNQELLDPLNNSSTMTYKEDNEGRIVYCTDSEFQYPGRGLTSDNITYAYGCSTGDFKPLGSNTNVNQTALLYIYNNGYHGQGNHSSYSSTKYLTGDYLKDYYITSYAIWSITSPDSDKVKNIKCSSPKNDIETKICALITDANKSTGNDTSSLSLNVSDKTIEKTADGKYYISKGISISGENLTNNSVSLTVSGIDGAFVTDDAEATTGKETFTNSNTVYVKIPADKYEAVKNVNLTLNAKGTGVGNGQFMVCNFNETNTVVIDGETTNIQRLMVHKNETKTVTATLSFSATYVNISKRSITGSDEVPGAKLKITLKDDKEGKIVKDLDGKSLEWTSGEKPVRFNLGKGTYVLTETIAPEGYELSDTKIEFTVTADGKVLVDGKEAKDNLIVFKNTPEAEQVKTGSKFIYIAILGILAIGAVTYFGLRKKD